MQNKEHSSKNDFKWNYYYIGYYIPLLFEGNADIFSNEVFVFIELQ